MMALENRAIMLFNPEQAEKIAARYRPVLVGMLWHGDDVRIISEVEVVKEGWDKAFVEVRAHFSDGNTYKAELDDYLTLIGLTKNYD